MILPHNLVYTPTNHPKDNWLVDRLRVMPPELLFDTACTLPVLCFPCTGGSPTSSSVNTEGFNGTLHNTTELNKFGVEASFIFTTIIHFRKFCVRVKKDCCLCSDLCFLSSWNCSWPGARKRTGIEKMEMVLSLSSVSPLVRASTHYSERLAEAV